MGSKLLDVEHQLVFYGAYHSNKINVLIHIFCVPLILWSSFVIEYPFPTPSWFPAISYTFNDYLAFEFNWAFVWAAANAVYYIALEPVAGLLYAPQMAAMLLTATSLARRPEGLKTALAAFTFSWIMQFIGHGVAEKRAPALLDNLLGAFVLAPFFVHLELLFGIGYNPALHKKVQNGVGVEITKFRTEKAQQQKKTK